MFDDQVTILIPTSPIPRHPATDLIERCVQALRSYFPMAKFIVMVDGVRPQLAHRREQYDEYKYRLARLCNEGKLGNTELRIFSDPSQQAIMTRNVLQHHVTTPYILFMEHDIILRTQPGINLASIFDLLNSGNVNLVRFYGWQDIWHEHAYLMRGEFTHKDARFVKTVQYSQWPLISRTDYHWRILGMIPDGERAMIEPAVYGRVANSQWEDHKLVIYLDSEKVFTHYDGRTDEVTGQRDPAEW